MARLRYAVLTFGFVLAGATPVRADDEADVRKIIEKAVTAHGGQEKLDKLPGSTVKFKGTFHGTGEAIAVTGEVSTQGRDKQRVDMEIDAGGMKFPLIVVFAGDKGWTKFGKDTTEFDKDQLEEAKEQGYSTWVTTLSPLKDKQFKLATLGEIKVEKRPALGVKVSSKGHRDVELYFDKETGLLVKAESRVKDEMSGQEVSEESFPSEYKEVQGTKQPMKFLVKRNGKPFMEGEATEVKMYDKLDASLFEKP